MAQRLVKAKLDGTPYTRIPKIEEAIDAALVQDLNTLTLRAEIRDRSAKDYLPSECLVYLIRDALRRRDEKVYDKLLPVLLARCDVILRSKVDSKIATAPQLREDILGDFAALFAIDGSPQDQYELDFFEVRFNMAFRTFRIERMRPELDRLATEMELADPDSPEAPIDEELRTRLFKACRSASDVEERIFRKQVHAAIRALPPEERRALVLCYMMGYKEESVDPNEETAATLCGVTGRTIRNRLARAIAKLSRLKEDV